MRSSRLPARISFALIVLTLFVLMAPSALPAQDEPEDASKLQAKTFKGLELRGIGPALMSGRIADIAIHPEDQSVWYVGVGSGNVWKTTNAGTTWTPVFDDQGSYSIGCITVDPHNPSTVWVGTGENVGGRHVGYGDGVYKSLDGGTTWTHMGLAESEHLTKIVVHPKDPNTVFVASEGPLWSPGGDRGLYKSTDGGATWKLILDGGDEPGADVPGNEYTGVNDFILHPTNPDVMWASTHQHFRNTAALINGGPLSGIHKSTDGGETWRKVSKGLPEEDMGKIGLAVSPFDPNIVYATVELAWREGGFYRSTDGGESWEKRSDYLSGGTGPHYYQEIYASPHKLDRVYQMDVNLHVTEDGGKTFTEVGEEWKHGDNHAMAFDPKDPNYLVVGSDGGLYESWDLGTHWKFVTNLPVTQFYKLALDNDLPFYNIYGGTQDNSTQGGPSRTDNTSGIRSSDWFITLFADGHQPAVDPTNPDIVYSEWQQGNPVRYDRRTGEIVYIQPQPEPGDPPDRWNWDSPILISPHDPARLYYASQRVWRSDDRGDSWRPISGDLSRGIERLQASMMSGRVWSIDAVWDLWAMSNYGNVTSVDESPLQEGLIYAGTDDGLIQVTEDGGATWRQAGTVPGVPATAFVNNLRADLHDVDTVYAVLDNHKTGDFAPYVVKSTDRGRTWSSITGDLPDRHIVWRIVQDHVNPSLLFVGTEFGIFFTLDGGGKWIELEGGVPNIAFRDLAIHKRENDLVGASFGRGFYVFDDYTPLRQVTEEVLEQEVTLFPVRRAYWYIPRRPLGGGEKASQGADFFTAPNPPFGAVFTYYLADGYSTRKETRNKAEKKVAEEGGDNPHPPWEELRQEAEEEAPAMILTVRDADGEVVRRVTGPVKPGFHRVAWDLRYPERTAETGRERGGFFGPEGFLAAPGTYTVELAKRVDGEVTDLGEPQTFEVVPLPGRDPVLNGMEPAQLAEVLQDVEALRRSMSGTSEVIDRTAERLERIRAALDRSTVADHSLGEDTRALEDRLSNLRVALEGNAQKDRIGEPRAPSVEDRLGVVLTGVRLSTYGPTPTHLRSFELAQQGLVTLREDLNALVERDLPALEERLEAAGVPWTPGRPAPGG